MRGTWIAAAVVLAFAAGWLGRGCADGSVPQSGTTTQAAPTPATSLGRTAMKPRPNASAPRLDQSPDGPGSEDAAGQGTAACDDADAGWWDAARSNSAAAGLPKTVFGVVVDSVSGAPIAGVNIHLCAYGDDGDLGWNGFSTDDAGRFSAEALLDWMPDARRFELIAGRFGYRPARVPVATAEVRVELEKLDHAPLPGRIVGTALGEDGKPLTGRLLVHVNDDLDMESSKTWTLADANGRFAIEGVSPGHWTLRLAESRDSIEVNVVESQDASIELRACFDGPHPGAFAPGEMTQVRFDEENERLFKELNYSTMSGHMDDAALERRISRYRYDRQQLELQWLRGAPGRDVVVTCGTVGAGTFVRFQRDGGANCQWRARVADGAARFPSIPYGKWRAVLVRPGEPDVGVDLEVVAGDGALSVSIPSAK
jgi:hypothetical protein